MAIYFTADLHLHHNNIIRYAHRNPPFRNIAEMDRGLIKHWNSVVKRHDTVYHLGDFCFARKSNISEAMRIYGDAMRMFHGRTVFLRGNHDNGLQHADYFICCRIDGIKVFMRHWPPWEHPRRFPHSLNIPFDVDLILCGHVHDKWKYHVHSVGQRRIPVINVGIDVWGYKPIDLSTIMKEVIRHKEAQMLGRIKKGESVIGMRAVSIRGKTFNKGPVLVRGSYAGKMRDWYMVRTRRGKIYLCSDIKKED